MSLFRKKPNAVGVVKTKRNGMLNIKGSWGWTTCGCGEQYDHRDTEGNYVRACPRCGAGHP